MAIPKKREDVECEDIIRYCPWDGIMQGYPNGVCEGMCCDRAYEEYLEEFDSDTEE